MSSSLPKLKTSASTLDGADDVFDESQSCSSVKKQPQDIVTSYPQDTHSENLRTREKLLKLWKGKEKDGENRGEGNRPLELLDLPIDVLKEIIKEYTRKFSLGNGPDEWIKEYLINGESGKMLGTLVALALARMPNLETFVWDMPTGILRDCWLALSSLSEGKDNRDSKLEKVWVRFHNNREIIDTPEVLPTASQGTQYSSGHASGPSPPHSSNLPERNQSPSPLEWSYRHVEHPNFSLLPPLRSLNVLNIDELAYLEELSVLIECSVQSLRELRIGFASAVPRDGFASTRDLNLPIDQDVPTAYQGALDRLMNKILQIDIGANSNLVDSSSPIGYAPRNSLEVHNQPNPENMTTTIHRSAPTCCTLSDDSGNAIVSLRGIPSESTKAVPTPDPAGVLDSLVVRSSFEEASNSAGVDDITTPTATMSINSPGEIVVHYSSPIVSNAPTESSVSNKALKQHSGDENRDTSKTSAWAGDNLEEHGGLEKRLKLEELELEYVHLNCHVLLRAIDWSAVTTLTLLHCDSHEALWRAFRRAFTPRQARSQPMLRRKSKMHLRNFSSLDPSTIPQSEYRMNLRRLHTNTVSSALIAFLKETLAPNSLEWLFLQDGGIVSNASGGRGPYDSNVSVEAICRGPLRRHRSSLKKIMIDSGDGPPDSRGRSQKWQKWKLDRDALSFVTSGKMSALREVAFSLDYRDWHVFLQRIAQIPHVRSIYLLHIADHPYGHHLNAKELALQIMDIVAIRPDMELCYMGIANKCFEILEGRQDDDAANFFYDPSAPPANPGPDDANSSDEDSIMDEEDDHDDHDEHTPTGNPGHALGGDDSDLESQDEGAADSEDESAGSENGTEQPNLKLREILFYDDKISIFKARHGKL
ncbi:MAG: hypothetical protein Q9225_003638 [Loekoesia sp. 1 TL-2023]